MAPPPPGKYVRGIDPYWTEEFTLFPDGTFQARRETAGVLSGEKNGKATFDTNRLLLVSDSAVGTDVQFLPAALVVVLWYGRCYLVSADEMRDFCNSANRGVEPRGTSAGMFFLRPSDTSYYPLGLPSVPSDWVDALLQQDVEGRTISAGGDGTATVNIGAQNGVREGMQLVLRLLPTDRSAVAEGAPLYRDKLVEVVGLDEGQCTIRWDQAAPIPTGLRVVSRPSTRN